jgi:hypothetical protein
LRRPKRERAMQRGCTDNRRFRIGTCRLCHNTPISYSCQPIDSLYPT